MIFGMYIRLFLLLAVGLLVCSSSSVAQRRYGRAPKRDTTLVVKAYSDSLVMSRMRIDSVLAHAAALSDTADGRYYRLFVPLTFYHSAAKRALGIFSDDDSDDSAADAVDAAMLRVYMSRPDLVLNTETRLEHAGTIRNDVEQMVRPEVEFADKAAPLPDEPEPVPVEFAVHRPNFWTFGGDNSLQIMQNYVSENWHKGGESNYSMVGSVVLTANYNNKRKLKFENKLEMKLGYQTSPSDTLHKYKTNNDLLRYTGKLGLQAAKRWYYTVQLLAYTQFAKGLKSNKEKVFSDFMSPITP